MPAKHPQRLTRLVAAAGFVGLANGVAFAAGPTVAGANLAMLFLLSVLVSAVAYGLGPALMAALLAAVTYNFFFLEPHYTFQITHPADLLTFSVFFAVALATGWLAGRARDSQRRTAAHARATEALLDASRALARAATPDEAAQALAEQIASATGGRAVILIRDGEGLRLAGAPPGLAALSAESLAAAEFVWRGGDLIATPEATREWTFASLDGVQARVGVAGLRGLRTSDDPEVPDLTNALLEQGGVVIERAMLASAASENEALRQADQLRSGLLNSISHDFRTPLASILGSATTLSDYESDLAPSVRRDLLESIQQDAQRLNQHIGALLDMSSLEGGALRPRQDWTDVRELVGSALRRLQPKLAGHRVERHFAAEAPLVRADALLLEQAILNVLDNAAIYAPAGTAIRIVVEADAQDVLVAIEDEGPGIPAAELDAVFGRFRRLESTRDGAGGLGLGLSITKGFVEAMGGTVSAVSPLSTQGGTRFVIRLPKVADAPQAAP